MKKRYAAILIATISFCFILSGCGGGGAGGEGASGEQQAQQQAAVSSDAYDEQGNPTLFGVLELSGSELAAAVESQGFEWDASSKYWVSADGNDYFYVSGNDDYEYLYDEITGLDVNGAGKSCAFVIVVDDRDYASAKDAFDKLCNVDVIESMWLDDTTGMAIVQGPSGAQNVVIIACEESTGFYIMDAFNEQAIASGLLDEYLGDNYGHTIDEVRSTLF